MTIRFPLRKPPFQSRQSGYYAVWGPDQRLLYIGKSETKHSPSSKEKYKKIGIQSRAKQFISSVSGRIDSLRSKGNDIGYAKRQTILKRLYPEYDYPQIDHVGGQGGIEIDCTISMVLRAGLMFDISDEEFSNIEHTLIEWYTPWVNLNRQKPGFVEHYKVVYVANALGLGDLKDLEVWLKELYKNEFSTEPETRFAAEELFSD